MKCVDVTGARDWMVMENTSSIFLTQSSIDHLNLLYVVLCQIIYKQLQITFIDLGMKQYNVQSCAATC